MKWIFSVMEGEVGSQIQSHALKTVFHVKGGVFLTTLLQKFNNSFYSLVIISCRSQLFHTLLSCPLGLG